jgi:O-antigen/teichoic acid export membrane protein/SAM-dependent methyltransferase
MRFVDRVALTLLTRGLTILIGLVGSILTARWLGPEGRGVLAIVSVVTGLALQFGSLGLHSGNAFFVARDPRLARGVLGNSAVLGLLLGAAAGIGAIAAFLAQPRWFTGVPFALVVVAAATLPFHFLNLFFQNALLGMHEVKAFNAFEAAVKILTFAALVVYLVVYGGGPEGAVVLFSVFAALSALAAVGYCRRLVPFRFRLDRSLFARMIPFGLKSYAGCLLAYLVIRSDMLLVNYFRGTAAAGVYSIAGQVADNLLLVPATIGLILLPKIASEEKSSQSSVTARVTRHAALLMTVLCAGAWVLAGPAISLLYGPGFREAIPATRWLLPGVWALGMNSILMQHFGGQGMPLVTVTAPLAGAVLNLSLNAFVVPRFGIVGAAITSSVSYATMLLLSLRAFLRGGGVRLWDSLVIAPEELHGILGLRIWGGGAGEASRRVAHSLADSAPDVLEIKRRTAVHWSENPIGTRTAGFEPQSREFTREWFDEHARFRYVDYGPWMREVAGFDRHRGETMLEVGCGMGTDLLEFARGGALVSGVDLTQRHLDLAARRFALFGRTGRFSRGDAENLPFRDDRFDFVYSNGVLHHTPDTARSIREIHRVLRPGGTATILLYHRNSLHYRVQICGLFAAREILYRVAARLRGRNVRIGGFRLADHLTRMTDGETNPLTKVFSAAQCRDLCRPFREVRTRVVHLNRQDVFFLKCLPASILPFLARRWGWYVVIEATK